MKQTCSNCGATTENYIPPYMQPREVIKPVKMAFYHNEVRTEAYMIPLNDMFYEITSGQYRGNLVHRWSIAK